MNKRMFLCRNRIQIVCVKDKIMSKNSGKSLKPKNFLGQCPNAGQTPLELSLRFYLSNNLTQFDVVEFYIVAEISIIALKLRCRRRFTF